MLWSKKRPASSGVQEKQVGRKRKMSCLRETGRTYEKDVLETEDVNLLKG